MYSSFEATIFMIANSEFRLESSSVIWVEIFQHELLTLSEYKRICWQLIHDLKSENCNISKWKCSAKEK